jgi:tetratricopeptide (TPR) repeat protein
MKRLAILAVSIWILAGSAALANRAVEDDCASLDNDVRIRGCTELLMRPGLSEDERAVAYAMRALGYSLKGQYQTAIRDYDEAITLSPNYAIALNNRAWAYFKWGKPAEGLPDVEKSLRIDPMSGHSYDTRAHIKQWLGDPAQALRDYEKAMLFGGDRMTKLYQCGLRNHGLYNGPLDGQYSREMREALRLCVQGTACDPLPPDEECKPITS